MKSKHITCPSKIGGLRLYPR